MNKEGFTIAGLRNNPILSGSGLLLFILFLSVITSGCGGGGGDADTSSTIPLVEGIFVDSAVQGLEYETPTRTGITDAEGTFMYHEGDTIRFYIGDIMLGEAMAKFVMTPVDLVDGATDETHPAVVNMARFLQTVDDDMNPENGITITRAVSNAMIGHMIDFDMPTVEFGTDSDVVMAIDAMNSVDVSGPVRMMVSARDAEAHLTSSIMGMMEQGYMMGNGSSESFQQGVFIDSPVEGLEYETSTHTGITDVNGTFMYQEGDIITFHVGDIMLGEAVASSMMTPIDLVDGATDETHPAVINMARFLQAIDEDMNPENGITITGAMSDAMIGHMIDFNMDPDSFTYDPDVMMVMSAINEVAPYQHMRTLVSAEDAITQFSSYMNNMTTMMTGGSITTAGQTDGQMMSSGNGM